MILQEAATHSALNPIGPNAERVYRLYQFFLVTSIIVWIAVIVGLFWAAKRHRDPVEADTPDRESRAHRWIFGLTAVTVAVLAVSLVYDLALGHSLTRRDSNVMLSVRVIGHQWWWEVEYEDPIPQNRVHTANELHVPVGIPVALKLESQDVIHSFWAPSISGKKDLIPGHHNELYFRADTAGLYRVQCAEFCGLQHAKMAMYVTAEPKDKFAAWLAAQRQPAPVPVDTLANRGRLVFETANCSTCHTITGTTARGTVGPDLTHIATRTSLAAGTLSNTRGNLAGWIVDPQRIKPGVIMPSNGLEPADLQALLAYLGSLK
ncbi:MAG TPA: cytochrome c oxidase subunit II [Gemmatimonadaceae bacterium]|nr:cytochrome c oxidase subunit II [Gemmatimonadaceae bacterium]